VLLELALRNEPFKPSAKALQRFWNEIYGFNILGARDKESVERVEELEPRIEEKWRHFLEGDFRKLSAVIASSGLTNNVS